MIKKDACLWPSHKDVQPEVQDLFPNGGKRVIVYQGKQEPMEFTPMTGAQGLRPVKPTKDNGERNKAGYAFWNTIPYGATVEVKTLIS